MSWFGGGNDEPKPPSKIELAKTEVELTTDLYNKMVDMCFTKCVTNMKEGELSVGEMSCTDRCVFKYMSAQQLVGEKYKSLEAELLAQQEAAQNLMGGRR